MNQQELSQYLLDFIFSGRAPQGFVFTEADGEHNGMVLGRLVAAFYRGANRWPTHTETAKIIEDNPEIFKFHKSKLDAPPDPKDNLPFSDIPALDSIRNMSDVRRVQAMTREQLHQFERLTPQSRPFHEFNARLAYIQQHNIQGDETPVTNAANRILEDPYKVLRMRVARITPKQVGRNDREPGSSAESRCRYLQKRCNDIIDANLKRSPRASADDLWAYLQQEINRTIGQAYDFEKSKYDMPSR